MSPLQLYYPHIQSFPLIWSFPLTPVFLPLQAFIHKLSSPLQLFSLLQRSFPPPQSSPLWLPLSFQHCLKLARPLALFPFQPTYQCIRILVFRLWSRQARFMASLKWTSQCRWAFRQWSKLAIFQAWLPSTFLFQQSFLRLPIFRWWFIGGFLKEWARIELLEPTPTLFCPCILSFTPPLQLP